MRFDAGYPGQMFDPVEPVTLPRLGFCLPRLKGPRGAPGEFERLATLARMAEASGFDSLWVIDTPEPTGAGKVPEERHLEAYSLLGALAVRTESVDLGVLTAGPMIRYPAMVAKLVTGVDVISHGRALLALGLQPCGDRESIARLAEELTICRALVVEEAPSYTGRYYRIHQAPNRPRPVRIGGIPLVVVTDRVEAATVIARYADAVIVAGGMATVEMMIRALDERCREVGRRRSDVAVIWSGQAEDRPERTVSHLRGLADMGTEGFVLSFRDSDNHELVTATGQFVATLVRALERTRPPDS